MEDEGEDDEGEPAAASRRRQYQLRGRNRRNVVYAEDDEEEEDDAEDLLPAHGRGGGGGGSGGEGDEDAAYYARLPASTEPLGEGPPLASEVSPEVLMQLARAEGYDESLLDDWNLLDESLLDVTSLIKTGSSPQRYRIKKKASAQPSVAATAAAAAAAQQQKPQQQAQQPAQAQAAPTPPPPPPPPSSLAATGAAKVTAPNTAPKPERGKALCGYLIEVHWPLDAAWYRCRVVRYLPRTRQHEVVYVDDDLRETLRMSDEEWRHVVDEEGAGGGRSWRTGWQAHSVFPSDTGAS